MSSPVWTASRRTRAARACAAPAVMAWLPPPPLPAWMARVGPDRPEPPRRGLLLSLAGLSLALSASGVAAGLLLLD